MIVASIEQEKLLSNVGSEVSVSLENGLDTVSIVDKKTGKIWIKKSAGSMQDAFNLACSDITKQNQPKTNAETAELSTLENENKKLREQIAQLSTASKLVSPKSGTPSLKIETSQ
jgi:hypothetical protein